MFAIILVTVFRLRGVDFRMLMTPSFFNAAPVAQETPEPRQSVSTLDHANDLVRARLEDLEHTDEQQEELTLPVACRDALNMCRFWFEYAGDIAYVTGSCELDLEPCSDTQ
jgi:hypothetical protein